LRRGVGGSYNQGGTMSDNETKDPTKEPEEQIAHEIPPDKAKEMKDKAIFTDDDRKMKFYEDLRRKVKKVSTSRAGKLGGKLSEYLFLLPDFFVLVCRLAMDDRVPAKKKVFVGAIIAYVLLPLDIIPDFIPVIGHIDDLVLIVIGLNQILKEIDKQILLDNWSGEEDLLEVITKITATADQFLDKNVWRKINTWINKKSE
jgi:uncharacterized membrane protein YkvA (DUF1232 family)